MEDLAEAAAALVRERLGEAETAIVSGSGLGVLATIGTALGAVDYGEIPGLGESAVAGHASRWLLGEAEGRRFFCLLGRRHLYEGIEPAAAGVAMGALGRLGVKRVILTNAAGGLGPGLRAGDLMLIRDHLNIMFRDPCRGMGRDDAPAEGSFYDRELCERLARGAEEEGIELKEGVYGAVCGPNYETRAEVEMLRRMGADAVGMSTVPEVLAAARAGLRVAAVSLITNSHWGAEQPASHEEVLEAAARSGRRLKALLRRVIVG